MINNSLRIKTFVGLMIFIVISMTFAYAASVPEGPSALTFKAAAAYSDPSKTSATIASESTGSFSALLNNGFNLTIAGGSREHKAEGRNKAAFNYGKLGYKKKIYSVGLSAFSVDFGNFNDLAADDDEGRAFGLQFDQNFSEWGTDFLIGYRSFSLDRNNADYSDITVLYSGARIAF